MVVVASQTLFYLTNFKQALCTNPPAQLRDKSDMFADVAGQFAELWVLFNETLHVRYRFDICIVLRLGLVLFHVVLDVPAQVTKVEVHVLFEERILVR
jgi:hypothetical protein